MKIAESSTEIEMYIPKNINFSNEHDISPSESSSEGRGLNYTNISARDPKGFDSCKRQWTGIESDYRFKIIEKKKTVVRKIYKRYNESNETRTSSDDSEESERKSRKSKKLSENISNQRVAKISSQASFNDGTLNTLPAHLNLGSEVFNDAKLAPPFPHTLTNSAVEKNMTNVFRVINIFNNGMISLRSHSQLNSYLNMDAALQRFYKLNEDFIKKTHLVTKENIVKMGYYVTKLGRRYERCQFIQFTNPKDVTDNLRIRLLDYGVPMVVPVNTMRPMHKGFKVLAAQGYTAEIYDPRTKLTNITDKRADNEALRNAYQDKIFTVNVFKVEASYPECPHLFCSFTEEIQ